MRLQEFDAKDALAAPDHFAALAPVMACHQRKLEGITDIELGIDGDPRAARRDSSTEHSCRVAPSSSVNQAERPFICRRGSRWTFGLRSCTVMMTFPVDSGHQTKVDPVKPGLAHRLEI